MQDGRSSVIYGVQYPRQTELYDIAITASFNGITGLLYFYYTAERIQKGLLLSTYPEEDTHPPVDSCCKGSM